MSKKFLTLNIGAATVELAEYELGAKGALTLTNYGTAALAAPLDGGNAETILSPALLEIVREKGIRPGPVAISVSGQTVFPRLAAIPSAGGAERFEQLVRYEIEQNIPFPIDELVCDRQVLGETAAGDQSVLIVASKLDQIESITSAVMSAGFRPECVSAAPLAVTNAVRASRDDDACVIILDIGAKTSSLVILEGERIYNRAIPVAGNTITKEISTALGCSIDEAEEAKVTRGYVSMGGVTEDADETNETIAKVCRAAMTRLHAEVSRSVNFYRSQQGGSAPVKLYLTGGSALLPQIDTFFAESLGIEVEFFNPFATISVGAKVDAAALESDGALLASTAGLALQMAGAAKIQVSLLPPSIVSARAEQAKIPIVAVSGVLLCAGLVLLLLAMNHETDVIAAKRDAAQRQLTTLQGFAKKIQTAQASLETAEAGSDSVRQQLVGRSAAVQHLAAVRASLLNGMWIDKWEGNRVTVRYWVDRVKGEGGKTPGERVAEKLKGMACVVPESVMIADMSAIGKAAQVEQFTLEVKFK